MTQFCDIIVGNLLLSSGPSCAVSTLIPGIPNQTVQTMKGTCYSSLICRQQVPRTCGGIAAQNSTYFTNPGFPSAYNNTNTLDFMDFELMQPNDGNCDSDRRGWGSGAYHSERANRGVGAEAMEYSCVTN
ncbi:unnamed protein product [Oppiella nova]|uniref:Uncharacterized protein n=1 Tax=Oppiella nova TaxID=334625 RepID=A0A7R9QTF5_9ACAR|nr:unnamed protein product [Oppiella nova]CAG2174895.1 unnamed protein product [Oppiella nova]